MGVCTAPSTAMGNWTIHCRAHRDLAAAKAFFESARSVVSSASHHFLSGQPHRAGSSRHQAALLSEVGVQGTGDGGRVLWGERRGAELFPAAAEDGGSRVAGQAVG